MKRETGYYWVKYSGEWCAAYYDGAYWSLQKWLIDFKDSDFTEINETRILNPDEHNS